MDEYVKEVEKSIQKKYKKRLWRPFCKAINQYELVKSGDKIAVCISGGKDSMLMAKLFQELKKHNKFPFELVFIVMDPGYNEVNRQMIITNAKKLNIPIEIFDSTIFDSVFHIEKSPCYLCARMRRGHLYAKAKELGCNKIALGHHFDDVIETTLLSMFYGSEIKTMMPKLHSDNFKGLELIRPLYLVKEEDIISWKNYNGLTFLNCACRFTENVEIEEVTSKRQEIKKWIKELRKDNKRVDYNIFKSLDNINLDCVLGYRKNQEKFTFLDNYDDISK